MVHTTRSILFVTIAVLLSLVVFSNDQETVTEEETLDPSSIRNGDLVFRLGRGIFSNFFKDIGDTSSPFSHVGIAYIENNSIFVIHTEASELTGVGVAKKERLSEFIGADNAKRYQFFRVAGPDDFSMDIVLRTALKYVSDQVPFDTGFDLTDSDRLYCSELVYKAYKAAGVSLVEEPAIIQISGYEGGRKIEAITIGQLVNSSIIKPIHHSRRLQ